MWVQGKPEQGRRQKESRPRRPYWKRVEESTLDSGSAGGQDVKAQSLDFRVEA